MNGVDVHCTTDGVALDRDRVTASGDGVHLRVANTVGGEALLVADPVTENPTVRIPPGTSTVVLLAPPGKVRLRCEPPGPQPEHPSVTMTVEDPYGFYRSIDVPAALGCEPDATVALHDAAWGVTARAAADAYAAALDGQVRVTEGNGYPDHERQQFLVHVDGSGRGTLDAHPDLHPELGWRFRASYDTVCSARVFAG
ncbi:MAG TPA: hypothetical protein VEG38_07800 [Acidimicrobiia bacterium]|nr:hypothetical protein [Acidimicrobiia bacterium]